MKISEASDFNPEFPEAYSWGRCDSIAASNLGSDISNQIAHDLRTTDRNLTPGLRAALNTIAEYFNA